jgi:hypothetical protein
MMSQLLNTMKYLRLAFCRKVEVVARLPHPEDLLLVHPLTTECHEVSYRAPLNDQQPQHPLDSLLQYLPDPIRPGKDSGVHRQLAVVASYE